MLEGELSADHTPLEMEHIEDDDGLDIEKIRAGLKQDGVSGQHTPRSVSDAAVEIDSIDLQHTDSNTNSFNTTSTSPSMSGVFGIGSGKRSPSVGKSSRTSFSASIGERIRSMSIDSGKNRDTPKSNPPKRSSSNHGRNDVMARWLGKGNVIYKSVGMGLMDLVVGREVLALAKARDIGVSIPNF